MDPFALRSRTALLPAHAGRSCASLLSVLSLLLLTAACSGGGGGSGQRAGVTPAGIDSGIMYGQGDMQYVIDHFPVFKTRMGLITPSPEAVSYLRDLRKPVTLKIFMGTWCIDSQRHVPELFGALQEADNRRISVEVIGMDRSKKDRDGLTEQYAVALSPTIVVEQDGLELGRMVEVPIQDAASDVVAILRSTLGG